ncbi:hypothetical protein OG2516_00384 [Oceanicola granulosus HTCC2516]|uniref:Methyltransferase type 12 domain-containing protein n=1 Tax=Oceanicola granulosus (strain ATCC BAA-861 / DSM 15982 / KCTC 12143 / HTCC2516) TaxID=314256 RepID=Q2CJG3_OCEGH|nr:class I SAM-dependent methyltransferase [Oceanicola granulosus]EAR52637.1 hypothetical protein OG2516_00384 [Oceanicola granulosus HTCC2516]
MADRVRAQYEAYPYPARDPADEARRLIVGSPSDPREIDHVLFGGRRDWSVPLRALVAGGGTGDGLVQLAQKLAWAGRPCEITYIDLSERARAIAEARLAARDLGGVRFVTGSLLDAGELGPFDYIDCCGVLHHLPDPVAGFAALRAALAPGGGIGFMVYAPYGRTGVYPLQEAFGALFAGLSEADRLAAARTALARLPEGHPFRRNPHLADYEASDAGFYDLLLHSQDRAFPVRDLHAALAAAGLRAVTLLPERLYDPARFVEVPEGLDALTRMEIAEKLDGTMKVHIGYAVPADDPRQVAEGAPDQVPHLAGPPERIARQIAATGRLAFRANGHHPAEIVLPEDAAPLLAAIDGHRTVEALRAGPAGAHWDAVAAAFSGWNLLHYARL